MRWKSTLVLLVATVGIGAYISLYEIRQPTPEERERRFKYVLDISPDAVTNIVLDLPLAKATFTRTGSEWRLSTKNVRANGTLINQLLTEASPLLAERVLGGSPEQPLDPKAFGLDPATGWVTLATDTTATTLLIGDATPVGENRYMKRADRPEIFVVSSAVFQTINQPLESYRDPLLIRFAGWLAQELAVASPTVSYTLMRRDNDPSTRTTALAGGALLGVVPSEPLDSAPLRSGRVPSLSRDDWQLTRPYADRADHTSVNTLLSRLGAMQIKRFVDDAPNVEQLSTWGFDQPRAELSLRYGDAATPATLFFGHALPEDAALVYAKRSDEPSLYAVAAAEVDRLLQDPNELRAKACFQFFTGNVTKVQLVWPQNEWTLERNEASEWHAAGQEGALDTNRVEMFLNSLADVRVERFVDEVLSDLARYDLTPPKGSVTLWTSDTDAVQRLDVGAAVEDSKNLYGRIEGRTPIVVLPERLAELLAITPDKFKPETGAAQSP